MSVRFEDRPWKKIKQKANMFELSFSGGCATGYYGSLSCTQCPENLTTDGVGKAKSQKYCKHSHRQ